MKHKIEIAPNLAIYIDGERVIGSKPHGLFLITEMIVSDEDLKRLSDRCLEVISDRKTENGSEKPNNSTISKMEQVEQRSCDTCKNRNVEGWKNPCLGCTEFAFYEPKTEPTGYNLSPVEDESQTADVCTWDGKIGEIEIHNILYEPTYNEDNGSM